MNKNVKLFVCASCEWIFKKHNEGCPKCGFVYYGAHFVYGKKAYHYFKTQKPWKEKKLGDFLYKINKEILDTTDYKINKLNIWRH